MGYKGGNVKKKKESDHDSYYDDDSPKIILFTHEQLHYTRLLNFAAMICSMFISNWFASRDKTTTRKSGYEISRQEDAQHAWSSAGNKNYCDRINVGM